MSNTDQGKRDFLKEIEKKVAEVEQAINERELPKAVGALKKVLGEAIAAGIDPNTKIGSYTLLGVAIVVADVDSVNKLISNGANVTDKNIDKAMEGLEKSPVKKDFQAIVASIISKKVAEVEQAINERELPKAVGALKKVLGEAIAAGIDPNTKIGSYTLLGVAIGVADVDSVNKLISNGANVTGKNIDKAMEGLEKSPVKKDFQAIVASLLLGPLAVKDGKAQDLNEEAKNKLQEVLGKAQIPEAEQEKIIELAVKTGHYEVVNIVIKKMATGADEAKKKENAQALKTQARDKAGALQNEWRTNHPVEGNKEGIETPYDALVNKLTGVDEAGKEQPDFARKDDESLADWYLESAGQWQTLHGETTSIAEVPEEKRTEDQKTIALKADQEEKIAAAYTKLYELEAKLADPNISADDKKVALTELASTSSMLMGLLDGYNKGYSNVLSETGFNNQKTVLLQANGQYQARLSELNQQKPKAGGRSGETPGGNTPPTDVTIRDPLPPQFGPKDLDEKTGVVRQATLDSVAHAKHDGSQEKSWWQRNQEWIWWTLGILVAATLGFFAFKKGGWFNKDDKKSSTVAVDTNTNQNTNQDTNQDTNSGNDNSNTDNSGTTNDTLANNSKLYSSKEVNDAIAANRQNIINQDR